MQRILSTMRQAIEKYNMIEEGDKIAVCLSGGKDSITLLMALKNLQIFYPKKFELIAISINPGFEFFETSAKDNIKVKQTFERLVDIICDKMSESLETDPAITAAKQNTRLKETPPPPQPTCGC